MCKSGHFASMNYLKVIWCYWEVGVLLLEKNQVVPVLSSLTNLLIMAAFFRSIRPHLKPLGLNCATYGVIYSAGEATQQSKAIYYDVSCNIIR